MPRSNVQRRLLKDLTRARSLFESALARAAIAEQGRAAELADFITQTREAMDGWVQRLQEPGGDLTYRHDCDEILALSRRRAYVLPWVEVLAKARAALSELHDWGVPASVVSNLEQFMRGEFAIKDPTAADLMRARAALNKLFEEYDYWDWFSNWYVLRVSWSAVILSVVSLICLTVSLQCLHRGLIDLGFLLAGAAGTGVSIVGKMPTLSVYGDVTSSVMRLIARFTTGVVASAIGLGLLSSSVINVALGDVSVAQIIRSCADHGGMGTLSGRYCPLSSMLVLVSLAVLFGFSERAMASFEQTIFGKSPVQPAPAVSTTPVISAQPPPAASAEKM